jgi:hypothetical protein
MRPDHQELAACDGGNSGIEDRCRHSCATGRKQDFSRTQTRTMGRGIIELDEIRLRHPKEPILGQVSNADQLMRTIGLMTRRVGSAKRDAKLHVGDFP